VWWLGLVQDIGALKVKNVLGDQLERQFHKTWMWWLGLVQDIGALKVKNVLGDQLE
jgi:hypothetical protein